MEYHLQALKLFINEKTEGQKYRDSVPLRVALTEEETESLLGLMRLRSIGSNPHSVFPLVRVTRPGHYIASIPGFGKLHSNTF